MNFVRKLSVAVACLLVFQTAVTAATPKPAEATPIHILGFWLAGTRMNNWLTERPVETFFKDLGTRCIKRHNGRTGRCYYHEPRCAYPHQHVQVVRANKLSNTRYSYQVRMNRKCYNPYHDCRWSAASGHCGGLFYWNPGHQGEILANVKPPPPARTPSKSNLCKPNKPRGMQFKEIKAEKGSTASYYGAGRGTFTCFNDKHKPYVKKGNTLKCPSKYKYCILVSKQSSFKKIK